MPAQQPLDEVLRRVQGEYTEMPGLRLTTAQAQRLWGLDRVACDALLDALVDAKFLFRTRDGAFVRSDQGRTASWQAACRPAGRKSFLTSRKASRPKRPASVHP